MFDKANGMFTESCVPKVPCSPVTSWEPATDGSQLCLYLMWHQPWTSQRAFPLPGNNIHMRERVRCVSIVLTQNWTKTSKFVIYPKWFKEPYYTGERWWEKKHLGGNEMMANIRPEVSFNCWAGQEATPWNTLILLCTLSTFALFYLFIYLGKDFFAERGFSFAEYPLFHIHPAAQLTPGTCPVQPQRSADGPREARAIFLFCSVVNVDDRWERIFLLASVV